MTSLPKQLLAVLGLCVLTPNPPDNGSCYLIRHRDGRYDWGTIFDPAHPVPAGQGAFGHSWFTAQAGADQDPDTSIWLLGFNPEGKQIVRRLHDGASTGRKARRLDPETLVGTSELFVYYTLVGGGRSELRLCRTGITPLSPGETTR